MGHGRPRSFTARGKRPMTKLQEQLAYLDAALTRKDWRTVSDPNKLARANVETIASETYYLSDGGYSRIGYDVETGRIFLDSVSRQEVKDGWKFCKELIADVEKSLAAEWGFA